MGRIVPVIYREAEGYSVKDSTKSFWFQNVLDDSNIEEYEVFRIEQRRARDNNIAKANKELKLHGKPETCIMGQSMNGRMIIALEIQ